MSSSSTPTATPPPIVSMTGYDWLIVFIVIIAVSIIIALFWHRSLRKHAATAQKSQTTSPNSGTTHWNRQLVETLWELVVYPEFWDALNGWKQVFLPFYFHSSQARACACIYSCIHSDRRARCRSVTLGHSVSDSLGRTLIYRKQTQTAREGAFCQVSNCLKHLVKFRW